MARNIEIKAKITDLGPVRAKCASLASGSMEVIHQKDVFFVVARGRLKVREFSNGSGELISYQRPNHKGPKESVYTRVACEDARALVQALGSVLPIRGTVLKRRELFLIGRTRIHLDQVENLGCYVELEVVLSPGEPAEQGHREAYEVLDALGIKPANLVGEAYIDMLETPAV
jgi:predicted adenylyl cyclase CyaB